VLFIISSHVLFIITSNVLFIIISQVLFFPPVNIRLSMSKLEVCRFETYLDKNRTWTHGGPDDCLDFTANFDCYINGIIVFGSKQYSGQHEVNINILNDSIILGSTSTKLNSVPGIFHTRLKIHLK
jgi:hypothetical protein